MRPTPLLLLLALMGCEAVTGFDDLSFEPEPCVPDDPAVTCDNQSCGSAVDNCGNDITCEDRCEVPFACNVGGVGPNECGCTGGLTHETPLTPAECPAAETFEGRSYYFCNPLSWDDARAFCRNFGTDLVVIQSASENAFVTSRMLGKSWIGLMAEPPCDNNLSCLFSWVDGTIADDTNFSNWNEGEPNNSGGGEFCVEVQNELMFAGRWNDVPCSNVLNFVCETTCPDG